MNRLAQLRNVVQLLLPALLFFSCEDPLQPRFESPFDPSTLPYVPSSPSDLRVTVVNDSLIRLQWTDQSENEDSFRLFMSMGNDTIFRPLAVVNKSATSFEDTLSKKPNTVYRYRVYASSGEALSKGCSEGWTSFEFPAPTISLFAGSDSSRLTLQWESTIPFATETVVQRRGGSGGNIEVIIPPGVMTFVDTTVDKRETYEYQGYSRTVHNVSALSGVRRFGYQVTNAVRDRSFYPGTSGGRAILSEDERLLISVDNNSAAIVDYPTGAIVRTIDLWGGQQPTGDYNVSQIALSRNKLSLALLRDTSVYVYDIPNGMLVRRIPGSNAHDDVALDNDGSHVFFSGRTGDIECWDIAGARLVWKQTFSPSANSPSFHTGEPSLWLRPDGQRLLVGCNGACSWLETETGGLLSTVGGGVFLRTPVVAGNDVIIVTLDGICYNVSMNTREFDTGARGLSVENATWLSADRLHLVIATIDYDTRILNRTTGTSVFFLKKFFGLHYYTRLVANDTKVLVYNAQGEVRISNLTYNWSTY